MLGQNPFPSSITVLYGTAPNLLSTTGSTLSTSTPSTPQPNWKLTFSVASGRTGRFSHEPSCAVPPGHVLATKPSAMVESSLGTCGATVYVPGGGVNVYCPVLFVVVVRATFWPLSPVPDRSTVRSA